MQVKCSKFERAIDLDDEIGNLLTTASSNTLCRPPQLTPYNCPPNTGKRWWTQEDGNGTNEGMCGQSAPSYKGFYPVFDPEDISYGCCSAAGYCGSGPSCNCTGCIDFYSNPQLILQEPVKPSGPVRWLTLDKISPGSPTCGYNASKMMDDGSVPMCNPDNQNAHCCSPGGYCGSTPELWSNCSCAGCIDFTKNPTLVFPSKTWIDSGPDMGKCGGSAPQVNGKMATCNPLSDKYHCCSNQGSCGSGAEYCSCPGCVNYQITINSQI